MNIQKLVLVISLISLGLFSSCSSDDENSAPVITDTEIFFTVEMNKTLTLSLDKFSTSDADADALVLVITGDENCTVQGQTITPSLNYVGDLFLQVAVSDGQLTSPAIMVKVTVVKVSTLYPLAEGLSWSYNDIKGDVVTTSKATMGAPVLINGSMYMPLQWDELVEENAQFLLSAGISSVSVAGGVCPTDTNTYAYELVPHTPVLNYAWQFKELEYVKTDKKFRHTAATTMKCTGVDVVVTVTAGVFNCAVFEYNLACTQRGISLWGMPVSALGRSTEYIQTERLYFAPNVGMVKSETLIDGAVAFTKELTAWSGSSE